MFIYLFPYLFLYDVQASINVLDSGILPLEKNSVGIQFYLDIGNEDRFNSCVLRTWSKKCCLTDSEKEDCDTMLVYGVNTDYIKPKNIETLIYVYPCIYQHDQVGYCDFVLESQCGKDSTRHKEVIKVPFDTRISRGKKSTKGLLINYITYQKSKVCQSIDQDSLNNCEPINCNLKYSCSRPFFDNNLQRCVDAAICEGDPDKDLPDIVYVPNSNICRDLESPLTSEDIYQLSKGIYSTTEAYRDGIPVKVEIKSNCTTISQNIRLIKDIMDGRLYPENVEISAYSECYKEAAFKILCCIASTCAFLLFFICCIRTSLWIEKNWSNGSIHKWWKDFRKKLRKKRQSGGHYELRRIDSEVRNTLLREVIVKDIPLELRDTVVDICDRMDNEVRWKRRYRKEDIGSQFSLTDGGEIDAHISSTSSTSSLENCDEEEKLLH